MTINESFIESITARGSFFFGNSPADTAQDWLDYFDDPAEADKRMDVGFWDSYTASAVAAAGFTPEQAKQIETDQNDAGIEYPSGALIYALCNGDASIADMTPVRIGEWGYGSKSAGHIVTWRKLEDAVRAAYDEIAEGDLSPGVLDDVKAAGGWYVEE